ncbi:MAG TPA: DUF3106 domain-containing protein [Candidatus Dormibacteraeota bacterium]|jgi:hypothetical protein|nr:DUF3106 domain-containing protein [Candidatus Dormibacteraeota bacterium]
MKLRFQFGTLCFALLGASLLCSPAPGQKVRKVGQAEAPRGQRHPQNGPTTRPGGNGGNMNNLPPRAFEHLREMPPDKQEQFLQNNERFRNLPPDQQARIRQRLQAWNKLTPAQQQEFRERQRIWEQMTPDQRREIKQTLLPRWQELPPPRRQAIMQRLHQLRDLSEPERQARLNDPSFSEGLNFEEREMLGQLAHLHVGMAPE